MFDTRGGANSPILIDKIAKQGRTTLMDEKRDGIKWNCTGCKWIGTISVPVEGSQLFRAPRHITLDVGSSRSGSLIGRGYTVVSHEPEGKESRDFERRSRMSIWSDRETELHCSRR